jgi:hypothetical protein
MRGSANQQAVEITLGVLGSPDRYDHGVASMGRRMPEESPTSDDVNRGLGVGKEFGRPASGYDDPRRRPQIAEAEADGFTLSFFSFFDEDQPFP